MHAGEAAAESWWGRLELGQGRSLKLVVNISADSSITLDSPDQGARGIPAVTRVLTGDSINFVIPKLGADFAGRRSSDRIDGVFTQAGYIFSLSLKPGDGKVNRPQTPQPPFPYSEREVTVENPAGGSVLSGTLCVPNDYSFRTPVVVLVTGSGLQNRDEELFEHKPFAVIADYLARQGIASLRYDDRGMGRSTGNAFDATTADFASDAKAVVDWLRNQHLFSSVGLLGHSEGGQIAYMLAAGASTPDFIISVAGPSVKGTETIKWQNKVALQKSGIPEHVADDFVAALGRVFDYKLEGHGETIVTDEMLSEFYPQLNDDATTRKLGATLRPVLEAQPDNPWMMYFLNYDAAEDLRALHVPALIIYGSKDLQVPPHLNLERARELAPTALVKEFDGLNHMMQHAVTGNVEEYGQIEETIAPEVLEEMVSFIAHALGWL